MEITFSTLGELPLVFITLLRTCVYCVMGATPMGVFMHVFFQCRNLVLKGLVSLPVQISVKMSSAVFFGFNKRFA